jgi:hypothetical protein
MRVASREYVSDLCKEEIVWVYCELPSMYEPRLIEA